MGLLGYYVKYKFIDEFVSKTIESIRFENSEHADNQILNFYLGDLAYRIKSLEGRNDGKPPLPMKCYNELEALTEKYTFLTQGHPEEVRKAQLKNWGTFLTTQIINSNAEYLKQLTEVKLHREYGLSKIIINPIITYLINQQQYQNGSNYKTIGDFLECNFNEVTTITRKAKKKMNSPYFTKDAMNYWQSFLRHFNLVHL